MIRSAMTKLDSYDYDIQPGVIIIKLSSTTDPDIVDIMSEIERSNGNIYVEGYRFKYLNSYRLGGHGRDAYMELDVLEIT